MRPPSGRGCTPVPLYLQCGAGWAFMYCSLTGTAAGPAGLGGEPVPAAPARSDRLPLRAGVWSGLVWSGLVGRPRRRPAEPVGRAPGAASHRPGHAVQPLLTGTGLLPRSCPVPATGQLPRSCPVPATGLSARVLSCPSHRPVRQSPVPATALSDRALCPRHRPVRQSPVLSQSPACPPESCPVLSQPPLSPIKPCPVLSQPPACPIESCAPVLSCTYRPLACPIE